MKRLPEGLKAALWAWALVRLPLELVLMGVSNSIPPGPGKAGMPPLGGPWWFEAFLRWDSGWYVRIIRDGFSYSPCVNPGDVCQQASIAFMPGFPYAAKALVWVGLPIPYATFAVTHLGLVLGLWGLWELARPRLGERGTDFTLLAALVFPSSIFFSAAYAEPLFLATGTWTLVFLERERPWLAGLCLAAGAVTRSQGLVLIAAVVLGLLWARRFKAAVITGALAGAALAAFLVAQQAAYGDALAFMHARKAWGVIPGFAGQSPFQQMSDYWRRTVSWELGLEGWLDWAAFVWLPVAGVLAWRRLGVTFGLFVFGTATAALQSGQVWALSRIGLSAFPAFLVVADLVKDRPRWARALFALGFALVATSGFRFVNGYFTGS